MVIKAQAQPQNEELIWFENVDWEKMADELTPILREQLLKGQLLGDLGKELAAGMEVYQFETKYFGGDDERLEPPRPEIEEINNRLNEELRNRLVDEYGVAPEEAKSARVERWGIQTEASGCCGFQSCRKQNGDWYTCGDCGNC